MSKVLAEDTKRMTQQQCNVAVTILKEAIQETRKVKTVNGQKVSPISDRFMETARAWANNGSSGSGKFATCDGPSKIVWRTLSDKVATDAMQDVLDKGKADFKLSDFVVLVDERPLTELGATEKPNRSNRAEPKKPTL